MNWREFGTETKDTLPKRPEKAFFNLDYKNTRGNKKKDASEAARAEILGWLKKTKDFCFAIDVPFRREVKENIALYLGYMYSEGHRGPTRNDFDRLRTYGRTSNYSNDKKIITNYIQEFVESKVSSVTAHQTTIGTFPTNAQEEADITNAESSKDLIKHLFYDNKIDVRMQEFVRTVFLSQDAAWQIVWDDGKGPEDKDAKLAKDVTKKIPVLDEKGEQVNDGSGKPKYLKKTLRTGDLRYIIRPGYDISYEPVWWGQEPRFVFVRWREDVDVLRQLYPDYADEISSEKDGFFDFAVGTEYTRGNHAEVYTFYYAGDEFLPKGWSCTFIDGVLLESDPMPFDKILKWPLVGLDDISVPGRQRGLSFIRNTKPVQGSINNMRYMYARLLFLAANPKIAVEENSLDPDHLDARPGIIPVKQGAKMPQAINLAVIPPSLHRLLEHEIGELNRINSIHPISQGLPPPGVKSGKAFDTLNQQYLVRSNSFQSKYSNQYISLGGLTLQIASAEYPKNDTERLINIWGPDDAECFLEAWKNASFETSTDVRLIPQSALGETKQAKIENSLFLRKEGLMSDDSVKENIGLGNFDRAYADEVAPFKMARRENDFMIRGLFKKIAPPTAYQAHAAHYITHFKAMQTLRFQRLSAWIRGSYVPGSKFFGRGFLGHYLTHVYLMVQEIKIEMSLGMSAKMEAYGQLPNFSLFAKYFMQGQSLPQGEQTGLGALPQGIGEGGQPLPLDPEFQSLPNQLGAPAARSPVVSGPTPAQTPNIVAASGGGPSQVTAIDLLRQRGG